MTWADALGLGVAVAVLLGVTPVLWLADGDATGSARFHGCATTRTTAPATTSTMATPAAIRAPRRSRFGRATSTSGSLATSSVSTPQLFHGGSLHVVRSRASLAADAECRAQHRGGRRTRQLNSTSSAARPAAPTTRSASGAPHGDSAGVRTYR